MMPDYSPPPPNAQRIDTLLALAHLFAAPVASEPSAKKEPRRLLPGLPKGDRAACDARLAWHDALSFDEQARWLRQTLSRVGDRHPQLDAHIDASHLLDALRREPAQVQKIICAHLPASLAATLATQLDFDDAAGAGEPVSAVINVVRDAFLRGFVALQDLAAPTQLDALSRAELVRTLRLLGVRETAFACRGIPAVETVAAFVRRFEPVDARAILTNIALLADARPARIVFAEQLLERMLAQELDSEELLDRTGLYVLAAALAVRDEASARYTGQKLPLQVFRELQILIDECCQQLPPRVLRERGAEVEAMASEARRITASTAMPATSESGAFTIDENSRENQAPDEATA